MQRLSTDQMYQILSSPTQTPALHDCLYRPNLASKFKTLLQFHPSQLNQTRRSASLYRILKLQSMPKAKSGKRNGASQGATPYDIAKNNVFKMNTDIGQHVLKNPGIAQVGSRLN